MSDASNRSGRTLRLLLAVLAFVTCSLAPLAARERDTRLDMGGYTIVPTAGWEVIENPQSSPCSLVVKAPTSEEFTANVNVLIQDTGDMTLEQYGKSTRKECEKMGGTVDQEWVVNIGGRKAGRIVMRIPMHGKEMKFHSTFIMNRGKTYLVTGTSLLKDFKTYAPDFEQMADSVRIK